MDYKSYLEQDFNNILSVNLVQDKDFGQIISVVLDETDLNKIEAQASLIIAKLDLIPNLLEQYGVEVISKGQDLNLDLNNLSENLNQKTSIKLSTPFNVGNEFQSEFDATLLEDKGQEILVQWNQKGRIRKLTFDKSNIIEIKKYTGL
ncbi:hypothetical protein [Mycoplasma nasistruthionis]|uniref:Ribosome maturation factor RimP n=1 Tax=Mycoplasma nasistruthionis TaxID=353852 RepID=A0A4Y6I569_9MOLU|nr:hypothetical protein [Mycoplasma nasistruthionis]QDF64745.1 hypothetical protein FIV53_00180 [Mycoplasma nasistruthionis]